MPETTDPIVIAALAGLFGLLIGSFLNVVILRLPVMMEREWRRQCAEFAAGLGGEVEPGSDPKKGSDPNPGERFDLISPPSRCPGCGHRIRPLENIPVLSWLLLRGRCSSCSRAIPLRYPAIELATALLSMLVGWHYGFGWECLAALFLTWALIALSVIDYDHQLLPDSITLPMLWAGLLLGQLGLFAGPADSVIGAAAGYLSLWSVYWLFKLLTGKEGMGHGDFKLLAMLGAWTGWQLILPIILISSVIGAIIGTALILFQGRDRAHPIPFGPYLAAAGWVVLLWGSALVEGYWEIMGW